MRASSRLGFASFFALQACGPTAAPSRTSPPLVVEAPPDAPRTEAASILADEVTSLGGGVLRGRLPRGEVEALESRRASPGMLAPSRHVITRTTGLLEVAVSDTGTSAGDDFHARVVDVERGRRCAAADASVVVDASLAAPTGFEVVAFVPDGACSMDDPPAERLWVRDPVGRVINVELACVEEECLPDRRAVLEAFVASFAAGTPTPAPAGPRVVGPSEFFALSAEVSEGFLVASYEGEDYVVYEFSRARAFGERADAIAISFFFSQSPNTLRQDYVSPGDRTRTVRGVIGGERATMIEFVRDGRTRLLGRVALPEAQIDVDLSAASPQALAELRAIVATMHLPETDE